jgi:hypothetical protein
MAKKEKTVVIQEEVKAPATHCYKFTDNWSIGGVVYGKGDCIHLTTEQLQTFAPYVKMCDGHKAGK